MGKSNSTLLVNEALIDLLNQQIQNELKAAAQYMAIAVYFEHESLPALAGFFFKQADEEREHLLPLDDARLDLAGAAAHTQDAGVVGDRARRDRGAGRSSVG